MSEKNGSETINPPVPSANPYITPEKAWEKIALARHDFSPMYISGMSSYGKTELVKQFFAGRRFIYYAFEDGTENIENFSKNINPVRKTPLPVVFDDLQFCNDDEKRAKILNIASRPDVQPIFISRSLALDWLLPFLTTHDMVFITENELGITVEQISEYFSSLGISYSEENIQELQDFILGNPYALKVSAKCLKENPGTTELIPQLKEIFARYMRYSVVYKWPADFLNFFVQLSVTESFTVELAQEITKTEFASQIISRANNIGSFLIKNDDFYTFRPIPLAGFQELAEQSFGSEKVRALRIEAGKWFYNHDEPEKACVMYEKADYRNGIKEVLLKNSTQNPSNGHYLSLSPYYFQMDEKEIESNVILMSGMSMICSMMFKIEESDMWLEKIKERVKSSAGKEKNEAKRQLAYLEIALPHHHSDNILTTMKNIASLIASNGLSLPEFCITSNLPSIMNGGNDFCTWSLKDREIAHKYAKIIRLILGKDGKSLINLALAESQYEKAGDNTEILSFMSRGQLEAELDNNMEMEFVAAGLLIRFYISTGQIEIAQLQYKAFERKCKERKVYKLLPNLQALHCRMDLYKGDLASAQLWMEKQAPNENKEIFAMLRFQYLTKIRCYITFGNLTEAFALIEKMKWFSKVYTRTYISMECKVLSAIVLFRMQDDKWRNEIEDALEQTRKFNFVRIISDEGAAVLPLLYALQEDHIKEEKELRDKAKKENPEKPYSAPQPSQSRRWFLHALRLTERMSQQYPSYCAHTPTRHKDFSDNARTILLLQMQGLSASKIAEKTGMGFENVRYHIKQNYKKLGVTSKSEAMIAARELLGGSKRID